ncbi:MAG TPA: SpoIIE family protein phosphatase [Actinophytocola sp.]|uniref:SpoIIE family protein phosphatase n=1 Tax=Actinophytocola sp. TaxID=1872138 RepID=UPI002DB85FBB|nr:SpoIIE family protein phosphatase [Actinophytocola sp.]HEU5473612.1 SpoIIE family protein phosphatase [Actinophytocola sp.]
MNGNRDEDCRDDHRDENDDWLAGDAETVRTVFNRMPRIIVAYEGPDLVVAAGSRAYRQFAGHADLVGKPLREALPELAGQQAFEFIEHAIETGESASLRDFRFQLIDEQTGQRVETFCDADATLYHWPDGSIRGIIYDIVDTTAAVRERQATQRRLAEAERRYAQARDVIEQLQRELLPAGVPVLPRVQIAASYLLADTETAAGGDWFDAVTLSDGRVALVVGDVVGHGVAASATMGQLRILLHERLAAGCDVAAAVAALDTAAGRIRGARAATVCVVVIDPATGALEYCTAGHPPPLVLSTAGDARYLPPTGAAPIGVGAAFGTEVIGTDALADGELVLLYTDGILERPGRELAQSTVELAQAAADIAADRALRGDTEFPTERVCTQTLELLTRVSGHTDDITLLAGQLVTPPPRLALRVAASPESLAGIRERLAAWLAGAHVSRKDTDALQHAVVELATNAIEHAYLDSPAHHTVTVTVTLTDAGLVDAQVADQGRWRQPVPSTDRGLGLQLAEGMVDTLHIDHDQHGTTATLTHRLTHPATLLTAGNMTGRPPARPPSHNGPLLVLDQPSAPRPRIRIDGPIDAATVTEFDQAIRTAGATGSRSLTLDLTEVTHLASAGIAVLHQLNALHHGNETDLRLYAPPGTPADMILSLVQLPHHTHDPDYPETTE